MLPVNVGGTSNCSYNGGPAFPVVETDPVRGSRIDAGMSLRDYFAAKALVGLLAAYREQDPNIYVRDAYTVADAMLKARGT